MVSIKLGGDPNDTPDIRYVGITRLHHSIMGTNKRKKPAAALTSGSETEGAIEYASPAPPARKRAKTTVVARRRPVATHSATTSAATSAAEDNVTSPPVTDDEGPSIPRKKTLGQLHTSSHHK
jgi:hypothetical protein